MCLSTLPFPECSSLYSVPQLGTEKWIREQLFIHTTRIQCYIKLNNNGQLTANKQNQSNQLLQRAQAMCYVSWNLANCCTTVQKLHPERAEIYEWWWRSGYRGACTISEIWTPSQCVWLSIILTVLQFCATAEQAIHNVHVHCTMQV